VLSKEPSASGSAQGCRIFSLRLSTRCTVRGSTMQSHFVVVFLRRRDNPFKFAHLSKDVPIYF
jgi:hypothetical protein